MRQAAVILGHAHVFLESERFHEPLHGG